MDTIIVLLIVGWAVFYLVRRYARLFRPRSEASCDCGCSACGQAAQCHSAEESAPPKP